MARIPGAAPEKEWKKKTVAFVVLHVSWSRYTKQTLPKKALPLASSFGSSDLPEADKHVQIGSIVLRRPLDIERKVRNKAKRNKAKSHYVRL